jgi:hypothetical protein
MKLILRRLMIVGLASGLATAVFADELLDRYVAALRQYRAGKYAAASGAFAAIERSPEPSAEVLKSRYFHARSLMRLGDWPGATSELREIYRLSASFYADWSCDFLLGICRSHVENR